MQNVEATIQSQFAASPILNALIQSMNQWVDPAANIYSFYTQVWDLSTAVGAGLDYWGRILCVSRVLQLSNGKVFGFSEGGTLDYDTFGFAPFTAGAVTSNYALSDTQYRLLLFAKAATNISSCSIPAINAILLALFPGQGPVYVTDGLNMSMTFTFTFDLTAVQLAIVSQTGALPVPTGVSVTVVQP
jgi:uncharacterized protein DUF2612